MISGKRFILRERVPNVLLIGNGINLCLSNSMNWDKLIKQLNSSDIDPDSLENTPYPLKAMALIQQTDSDRRKNLCDVLKNIKYSSNPLLRKLLNINFDTILTTNYTYELEEALFPGYCDLSKEKKRKKAFSCSEKSDKKWLVHTFNRVESIKGTTDIWHIHGELRRPSSLVLTHDDYARYLGRVVACNSEIGNRYEKDDGSGIEMTSWFDYFMLGNLFILGQGCDFSEFPLWWLLIRRMREHEKYGIGTIFYSPQVEQDKDSDGKKMLEAEKLTVLKSLGVIVENCDITVTKDNYFPFYDEAISNISRLITP